MEAKIEAKMEAIATANNLFQYNQEFYGIPLDTWTQDAHKYNCDKNNWDYFPLKKGCFGYDNLAVSIGFALSLYVYDEHDHDQTLLVADWVHQGWVKNYTYWRDNCPQDNPVYRYIPPFYPLNDERRNTCAITPFHYLDKEEREKDIVLAAFIISKIKSM